MKNTYIITLLLATVFSYSQVNFETSLSEAFSKAKQQNKPVFIEYYNSDCSVCKRLAKLLKEDAEIIAYYNSNFISYAMNTYDEVSQADGEFLKAANLHFDSVPVLLYFDKNQNFLHYSSGDISSESVVSEAKKAVLSDYNAAGLVAKYNSGDRSVRTLYAYSNLLIVNKDEAKLKKVSQDLFKSFNTAELPTKKSYLILKRVVKSTENGFFQFWINNLDKLNGFETDPNQEVELSHLKRIVLTELGSPDVKKWDSKKKDTYKNYILKLKIVEDPQVFF